MHHSLFTHPPTEEYLNYFQVLAVRNKAAVNLYV